MFVILLLVHLLLSYAPVRAQSVAPVVKTQIKLAEHEISLDKRNENPFVNRIFKYNILLTIAHMYEHNSIDTQVKENQLDKPFSYEFVLKPTELFAFHDSVLPTLQSKPMMNTNAHFNAQEGFKSDGFITGDGVCHLASLINWVAQEAKLDVLAPTNHNFAPIAQVPKEYGVSIWTNPNDRLGSTKQNLYIINTRAYPVRFTFLYNGNDLSVRAFELL